MDQTERRALEDFITSPDLVTLETRFDRFNIFEAMGTVRRELNHSSFLAFLLDPYGSHGLRDLFLRRFLQEVSRNSSDSPVVSAVELDLMDLMQVDVKREYENIDILLRNPTNRLIVLIENKVDSKQHDDQLQRYHDFAQLRHPGHRLIAVYLTPEGDDPGHAAYIPFTYKKVRSLILEVLQRESVLISSSVRTTLEQYSDLLGRHFMADTELKQLCADIYKRHRQAIEILIANIPDDREEFATSLREMVTAAGFLLDDSDNNYVRFIPKDLDIPQFQGSTGWTSSGRLNLFEFRLSTNSLSLIIQMGPGSPAKRTVVHAFAVRNKPLFTAVKTLSPLWQRLYKRQLLDTSDYELPKEQILAKVTTEWESFLETDLPAIRQRILEYPWPKN